MQFLYPALTWGFFLVLVPLAIHLINLMRQRRVAWGAMEFLLSAYRKQRKWIWLKQLALLALRMLAVAAIVAMLANLITERQWSLFLGGKPTHQLVLLDDSFSMYDRDTVSAFDRALQAVVDLARNARKQETPQRMTILRYSRAYAALAGNSQAGDSASDPQLWNTLRDSLEVVAEPLDSAFLDQLLERTGRMPVTELAIGPEPALALAQRIVQATPDEKFIVSIFSDFRVEPWERPQAIKNSMAELSALGATVQLVRCVEEVHSNLAITDLRPVEGIRAAGVPLFYEVSVRNCGETDVENVTIALQTYDDVRDETGTEAPRLGGTPNDLPALQIENLPEGATETRRFQVYYPNPGQHVVVARLEADALVADNRRFGVVELAEAIPVLVIDGDPEQRNARYLNTVFQPTRRVKTGIRATLMDVSYLRDVEPEALARFAAIYLLDVPRLDDQARRNVAEYVEDGGGVAIFLGPNSNLAAYNEWHEESPDLIPRRLDRVEPLGPSLERRPDLRVREHPLFQILSADRNPLLEAIRIERYVRAEPPADDDRGGDDRVLAELRSGHPFAMEGRHGAGRSITVYSTLAPLWNNWATQPTFVVFLLELQAYLDSQATDTNDFLVGSDVQPRVPSQAFRAEARVRREAVEPLEAPLPPAADSADLVRVTADETTRDGIAFRTIDLRRFADADGPWTDRAGVLSLWWQDSQGQDKLQRMSLNVAREESEMRLASSAVLLRELGDSNVQVVSLGALRADDTSETGFAWSEWLLYLVVIGLLVEQYVSYRASYHPPARSAA